MIFVYSVEKSRATLEDNIKTDFKNMFGLG
jgi:hypothetical protein